MAIKAKKIVIAYDFMSELGGLERVMFFQANALKKKHDVKLMFNYIKEEEVKRISDELELHNSISLEQYSKIKNEIIQHVISFLHPKRMNNKPADLVISHSFMATRIASNKKKKDKTPFIVMIHHPPNFLYSQDTKGWINNPSRFFAWALGKLLKEKLKKVDKKAVCSADLIISNSKYTSNRIKEIYGVESAIIYPPISDFFRVIDSKEKKEFLTRNNIKGKFLLAHGRVIPDKRIDLLLPVLKEIKNINLVITGTIEPKYKKELEEEIKKQGLENKVSIKGRIPKEDLLGYYNSAELFLMPTPKEDFGLTVVEAISCGCPVIAWNDGAGPSEVITKDNGLLAKPYDLKDFEKKLREGLNKNWNRKNVSKSVKKFRKDNIEKEFLDNVEKVISK